MNCSSGKAQGVNVPAYPETICNSKKTVSKWLANLISVIIWNVTFQRFNKTLICLPTLTLKQHHYLIVLQSFDGVFWFSVTILCTFSPSSFFEGLSFFLILLCLLTRYSAMLSTSGNRLFCETPIRSS